MIECYLGVGSNLGDRRKNIKSALQKIEKLKGTKIIKVSKVIQTNPLPSRAPNQGKFLNAALKIKTTLSAKNLLRALQRIEDQLGRTRDIRWGPRTIDLDILFYGDKVINQKDLKIPHPRMFGREFVLKPLREVI